MDVSVGEQQVGGSPAGDLRLPRPNRVVARETQTLGEIGEGPHSGRDEAVCRTRREQFGPCHQEGSARVRGGDERTPPNHPHSRGVDRIDREEARVSGTEGQPERER